MVRRARFRRGCGLGAVAAALALAGCDRGSAGPAPARVTLHVAAASDLQAVWPALAERYRREEPGVELVPTFGASGQLAEQVKAGAPFDLYLAANRAFAEDLATEHLLDPESVRPYAVGALVLVVGRDAKATISTLADLARPGVRSVAIANPETAPYGFAARQALQRAGLWEALGPKVVIAESVRQALQYVETGNAEAGLVGRAVSGVPGVRVVEIDPGLYDPIVQGLGVVARSGHAEAAARFARFLTGEAGQAVFAAHGFGRPGAAGTRP